MKKKILLIRTHPKNIHSHDSLNVGLDIVKNICRNHDYEVKINDYYEKIPNIKDYSIIGFSVFYLTQQLNVIPFLENNLIPILKTERTKDYPILIGGGQGFINQKPLIQILDYICFGEGELFLDQILSEKEITKEALHLWHNSIINSDIVIGKDHVIIEVSRGCKHRCSFCAYGHTMGIWREKSFDLVKEQIETTLKLRIHNISFLSCNFAGLSYVRELIEYCIRKNIHIMNTDFRIDDYVKLAKNTIKLLQTDLFGNQIVMNPVQIFPVIKVGLESFSEKCRNNSKKGLSDEIFSEFLKIGKDYVSNIHFYLIFGLPNDNYDEWFKGIELVFNEIKNIKRKIRIELSITDFEPMPYTPFENEQTISHQSKDEFLKYFLKHYFLLKGLPNNKIASNLENLYGVMHGHIGRHKRSYQIYMYLIKAKEEDWKVLKEIGAINQGLSSLKHIPAEIEKEKKIIEN